MCACAIISGTESEGVGLEGPEGAPVPLVRQTEKLPTEGGDIQAKRRAVAEPRQAPGHLQPSGEWRGRKDPGRPGPHCQGCTGQGGLSAPSLVQSAYHIAWCTRSPVNLSLSFPLSLSAEPSPNQSNFRSPPGARPRRGAHGPKSGTGPQWPCPQTLLSGPSWNKTRGSPGHMSQARCRL